MTNDHKLLRLFIESMIKNEPGSLDLEDVESLPAHLIDTTGDEKDDFGPVPPSNENDPYAMMDPFAKDF